MKIEEFLKKYGFDRVKVLDIRPPMLIMDRFIGTSAEHQAYIVLPGEMDTPGAILWLARKCLAFDQGGSALLADSGEDTLANLEEALEIKEFVLAMLEHDKQAYDDFKSLGGCFR